MATTQHKTCDVCETEIQNEESHIDLFVDVAAKRYTFNVHNRCAPSALGEKLLGKVLLPKTEAE